MPDGGWLGAEQQRAWMAYIRVQLRLAYEMNRQLLADSGLSLPDYDVLTGLSVADGERMQITGGRLRLRARKSLPMQEAAEAHRQLESGTVHERIILTLPGVNG